MPPLSKENCPPSSRNSSSVNNNISRSGEGLPRHPGATRQQHRALSFKGHSSSMNTGTLENGHFTQDDNRNSAVAAQEHINNDREAVRRENTNSVRFAAASQIIDDDDDDNNLPGGDEANNKSWWFSSFLPRRFVTTTATAMAENPRISPAAFAERKSDRAERFSCSCPSSMALSRISSG